MSLGTISAPSGAISAGAHTAALQQSPPVHVLTNEAAAVLYPEVAAAVRRFRLPHDLAEDVVQIAMLSLLRCPPQPDRQGRRAFIACLARRARATALRQRHGDAGSRSVRQRLVFQGDDLPDPPARDDDNLLRDDLIDLAEIVEIALPLMDDEVREVFEAVYVRGLTKTDAAALFGFDRCAVHRMIEQAVAVVRDVQEYWYPSFRET